MAHPASTPTVSTTRNLDAEHNLQSVLTVHSRQGSRQWPRPQRPIWSLMVALERQPDRIRTCFANPKTVTVLPRGITMSSPQSATAAGRITGLGASHAATAASQEYPSRPIRLISQRRRRSGRHTGPHFRQQHDPGRRPANRGRHRGGAGGLIGMEIGKDAFPDGYTLLSASTAADGDRTAHPQEAAVDPLNDYAFISLFGSLRTSWLSTRRFPSNRSGTDRIQQEPRRQGNMASAAPARKAISPVSCSCSSRNPKPCTCRTRAAAHRSRRGR